MANVKVSETIYLYGEPTDNNGLGGIDMNNKVFPNMGDPLLPGDSANKDYVDTSVAAIPAYNFAEKLNTQSLLVSQEPTALDTEQLVMFGPDILAGDVQLQTTGGAPEGNQVVFTTNGIYNATIIFLMGRSGGVGNANIALQACIDGVSIPNGGFIERIGDSNTFVTQVITIPDIEVTGAPTTLEFLLARSSLPVTGANDGGLFQIDITSVLPNFTVRASASIIVNRLY